MLNTGVAGATRNVFMRFVKAMSVRLNAHYSTPGHSPWHNAEMMAINELVETQPGGQLIFWDRGQSMLNNSSPRRLKLGIPVVTGFPYGPINAPMWGNPCHHKVKTSDMWQRHVFTHKFGAFPAGQSHCGYAQEW